MKAAISLPDVLVKDINAAKELGVSRSRLIRLALEEFLKRRRDAAITESINRYIARYGSELSAEDEAWLAQSWETVSLELGPEDWGQTGGTSLEEWEVGQEASGKLGHDDENSNLSSK